MRIRIRWFLARLIRIWYFFPDPDPDPTYNNGFIKLFLSRTKYKSESTNSSIKWWVIISNFIPTYLKYKNIFFFISISGRIRSRIRIRIRNFFSAEPDPDPWKKIPDPQPRAKLNPLYAYVVLEPGYYEVPRIQDIYYSCSPSMFFCSQKNKTKLKRNFV